MIRRWKYGNPKTGDSHIPTASAATTKKEEPNPKNRTESVKYVPGLKCKTCPRLDTLLSSGMNACFALFKRSLLR